MDPVTQGVLGAAAAQVLLHEKLGKKAFLYGALGGMAADLDVLIRSGTDPMVAWTYHRHFTHSLAFIPMGGLLTALPFIVTKSGRTRRQGVRVALATTAGYATHALLDAFTSYGTQLWWPFSNARVAWNWIGIVDPAFTLPLLLGTVLTIFRKRARPVWLALAWCALYMGFGGVQHARAKAEAARFAAERGHTPTRVEAFPGIVTNLLWRTLYEYEGEVYVDAVHVPWLGSASSKAGGSVPILPLADHAELARADARVAAALATFHWFADGWVAARQGEKTELGDLRYSSEIGGTQAMWGIEIEPGDAAPVRRWQLRPSSASLARTADIWLSGFGPED